MSESKDVEDFAEEYAREEALRAYESYIGIYKWLVASCESPIEKQFLAALIHSLNLLSFVEPQYYRPDFVFGEDRSHPYESSDVYVQAKVGPYRVDFLIDVMVDKKRRLIVIECDGHDYHERTKEQAAKDRSRDRWMAKEGIVVLRFTGSEIWADRGRCADEAVSMVEKMWRGL